MQHWPCIYVAYAGISHCYIVVITITTATSETMANTSLMAKKQFESMLYAADRGADHMQLLSVGHADHSREYDDKPS